MLTSTLWQGCLDERAYKLWSVGVQGVLAGAWHITACGHLRYIHVLICAKGYCAEGDRLQRSKHWSHTQRIWALRFNIPLQPILRQLPLNGPGFVMLFADRDSFLQAADEHVLACMSAKSRSYLTSSTHKMRSQISVDADLIHWRGARSKYPVLCLVDWR